MGHIYESHGRFSIEGRRESFYIHADYGYSPFTCKLADIKPGDNFRDVDGDTPYVVVAQMVDKTTVFTANVFEQIGTGDRPNDMFVIPLDEHYEPIDYVENDHPLGRIWRDQTHPEIEIADLDDLIAALQAYKDKL